MAMRSVSIKSGFTAAQIKGVRSTTLGGISSSPSVPVLEGFFFGRFGVSRLVVVQFFRRVG
jgi:hypothetical protein